MNLNLCQLALARPRPNPISPGYDNIQTNNVQYKGFRLPASSHIRHEAFRGLLIFPPPLRWRDRGWTERIASKMGLCAHFKCFRETDK